MEKLNLYRGGRTLPLNSIVKLLQGAFCLTLTTYAVLQQIYIEEGGHMKKRYDPELIKDELKKLIQQTH